MQEIGAHAFKGLDNLQVLSLRGNKISRLVPYALTGISGRLSCNPECLVDLSENDITEVQKNALAWIKRLSVLIGRSNTDLVLKAYSFYGVTDATNIRIFDIPSLLIEPRAFTNAENVGTVEIFNTRISSIKAFTFEGISDLTILNISSCDVGQIESFGFSGIQYHDTGKLEVASNRTSVLNGHFILESCSLYEIPQHAFRDTNLMAITIKKNSIMQIAANAFQGLPHLESIYILGNNLPRLTSNSLSSLKNLKEVIIHRNDIATIDDNAFYDSQEIEYLSIGMSPSINLTLATRAFAHLYAVTHFVIESLGYLDVAPAAFDGMVSVDLMEIKNVKVPEVQPHTFQGLSKVKTLKLSNCNTSVVHSTAFGDTVSLGTVDLFDLSTGNSLPCDCQTSNMLHDFENYFGSYRVTCEGKGNALPYHVHASDLPRCAASSVSFNMCIMLLLFLLLF